MKSNLNTISNIHIIARILLVFSIFILLVNITSAGGLEPPLKVAWNSRLGIPSTDIGPQSINLIVSDIAYVHYGDLKAIDANDGKPLWSKDWSASVVYKDGVLYAARAFSPSLYALDARTGEEIWRKEYPELNEIIKNDFIVKYYLSILNDTIFIVTNGIFVPDVHGFDLSLDPKGHNVFYVMAVDTDGNLKWYQKRTGDPGLFEGDPQIISKNIVIPNVIYSPDFTDNKKQMIAFNSTTGETAWEINNISFEGNLFSYKDILFIEHFRENDGLKYLFSWDEVPGNDNVRFKEFLKQEFGISWIETANIEKIDNGREIRVTAEKNYLSLVLNNVNTDVFLQIDDGRSAFFTANRENGKLNIYGFDQFYILAVSVATGETIWKSKVGYSHGEIIAIIENKLFINSEKIKVLDAETGETLDEYSSIDDPNSFGAISGWPDILRYNPPVISENIAYIFSTYIYAIDLKTGGLLWKGGKGGSSPHIYKNRLYTIGSGKLYAYEHGIEETNEEAKFQFFAMLGVPLILINIFIKIKKYRGRLYQSFQFSSILIIIVFLLILASETLSNQYLNLMDERLFISTPPDWMLYLLFPAISVIAGTFAGMRFNNKFLISAASGLAPFILAVAVSFLYLYISDKIIFLFSMVPLFISIPIIILISLFYGVIGSIIGSVLKKINGV